MAEGLNTEIREEGDNYFSKQALGQIDKISVICQVHFHHKHTWSSAYCFLCSKYNCIHRNGTLHLLYLKSALVLVYSAVFRYHLVRLGIMLWYNRHDISNMSLLNFGTG